MTVLDSIRLGLMPPMTGVVEIYGPEISLAAQIACDEVNEEGGVLGKPLELMIEDDGSLPESAVVAADKLIAHHRCVALIGNLLSNSRIAVAYRVAEPRKIPLLNFSFYEGSICSPYFFHFAALPNQQIDKMIPYMRSKYGPRMYFAGNNYEWPRGSIEAAKKSLLACGGEIVEEEYYPLGTSSTDLDTLIEKLANSQADVFVPYFAGKDQIHLLNKFHEKGLKNKMAVVMGHFDEAMMNNLSSSVRDGFYSSNTYFMSVPTAENKRYLQRLQQKDGITGIWPQGNGILTNFGEGAYLCVKAFALAANKAGSTEAQPLIKALETIQVSGPQGQITMDPSTHHARVNTFLAKSQSDGAFKIVESFGSIAPVIPERYQHLQINSGQENEEIRRIQTRIVDQMEEAVLLIHAPTGAIVYNNPGAANLFGYSQAELLGAPLSLLTKNSDRTPAVDAKAVEASLYRKGSWKGEIKCHRKDQQALWCSLSISAFTHPHYGEVWMAVYKDIHDLKNEKQRLETLNRGLNLSTIVTTSDENGIIVYANDQFCEVSGFCREELLGKTHRIINSGHHPREFFVQLWKTIQSGRVWKNDICNRRKDGSLFWAQTSISPILGENGERLYMSIRFDITQKKLAEQKLINASKMAALGELSAGIAHEINNPLTITITKVTQLQQLLSKSPVDVITLQRGLEKIHENSHRIARIVKGLSTFSRNGSRDDFERASLKSIVTDTLALCSERFNKSRTELQIQDIPDLHFFCRASQISQVLLNLLNNSYDAVQSLEPKWVRLEFKVLGDEKIQFVVTDSGHGILKENAEKIMQPFFTTKAVGKGTGLGLSISLGIAEDHGGNLFLNPNSAYTQFVFEVARLLPSRLRKAS